MCFFVCKQKTAYEMRISDWSSDVCSSDLLRGDEAAIFASGTLMLESEKMPLLPAQLGVLSPTRARLTLHEGRYHQVRRMFAAVGNHVEALHRSGVGGLDLGELTEGEWRMLAATDVERLFHTDSARPRRSASRPRRFEDQKPSGT